MQNSPSPAIPVKYKLRNEKKQAVIEQILNEDGFKEISTHRGQCHYLYSRGKEIFEANGNKEAKITQQDIADIYNEKLHTIKYHIGRYEDELNGEIGKNGRPFLLNDSQIEIVREWVTSHGSPPKFMNLIAFVNKKFGKNLDYNSAHVLLDKINYESVDAKPIEEERYNVSADAINTFYSELEQFCRDNDIPSFMVFNLDEEGNDPFVDACDLKIIVPKNDDNKGKKFHYPVKRSANHTTFLGCVNAHGSFVKPMIIIKRVTVEGTLLSLNYGPDRLLLGYSQKGYINRELFEKWLLEAFEPFVKGEREKYGYFGPGLIIVDGCTAHQTELFDTLCAKLNLRIFYLPPHSSNQLQVLDLGLFAIHKSLVKKLIIECEESKVVQTIIQIMNAWYSACTPTNIQGGWRAMGAVYVQNTNESGKPKVCIRFDQSCAIKLLGRELTREERQRQLEQMISPYRSRMRIDDFNDAYKASYPRLYSTFGSQADVSQQSQGNANENTSEQVVIVDPALDEESETISQCFMCMQEETSFYLSKEHEERRSFVEETVICESMHETSRLYGFRRYDSIFSPKIQQDSTMLFLFKEEREEEPVISEGKMYDCTSYIDEESNYHYGAFGKNFGCLLKETILDRISAIPQRNVVKQRNVLNISSSSLNQMRMRHELQKLKTRKSFPKKDIFPSFF